MGMATKLTILGAAGAAALAGLGAVTAAYKYYFDPDEGLKRRNATIGVVQSAAKSYGLDGITKSSMQGFMESLASAGR